ncbi:Phosphoinositide polyphosphatase [Carpediemonas membranifera]|uniref:Phosphoinositide polyphosphatase n=1 Tax=Carpediemonas membranifera TaxID=201153 RepID=A0A8J6EAD3_9EUKA|nr:Phosphoinositide polyphosphatase [Carpediemonas membranifera]|eukprot:KAG9394540.1 Phosphoinositide polyphosphatase [Carpediemonas membranifera]
MCCLGLVNHHVTDCALYAPLQIINSMSAPLINYVVYEVHTEYLIVATDSQTGMFRKIEISRVNNGRKRSNLLFTADPKQYSCAELDAYLSSVGISRSELTGLPIYGIIGAYRALFGYYLLVATEAQEIARLDGHPVYELLDYEMLPLFKLPRLALLARRNEDRYVDLFDSEAFKDCFFSPGYELAATVQRHVASMPRKKWTSTRYSTQDLISHRYVHNSFLLRPFTACPREFLTPVVCGSVEQALWSLGGREVSFTLVMRRSRHYAGTRYLKRGITDSGEVANHAETEQIVATGPASTWRAGAVSSFLQLRGSVPAYWTQEADVLAIKPDIEWTICDPAVQTPLKHFAMLETEYGGEVHALNLVKTTSARERYLTQLLKYSIDYVNSRVDRKKSGQDLTESALRRTSGVLPGDELSPVPVPSHTVKYTALDLSYFIKHRNSELEAVLRDIAEPDIRRTGMFAVRVGLEELEICCEQRGILRQNCVDCLDRTNVAQTFIGLVAFERQLQICGVPVGRISPSSALGEAVMAMYARAGDRIAVQYAGSTAHRGKLTENSGHARGTTLITSVRRYYKNAFSDHDKQQSINLFHGKFVPSASSATNIWDVDDDTVLHFSTRAGVLPMEPPQPELHPVKSSRGWFEAVHSTGANAGIGTKPEPADLPLEPEPCPMRVPRPSATVHDDAMVGLSAKLTELGDYLSVPAIVARHIPFSRLKVLEEQVPRAMEPGLCHDIMGTYHKALACGAGVLERSAAELGLCGWDNVVNGSPDWLREGKEE